MQKYLQTETTILPAGLADGQKKGHIPKKKCKKRERTKEQGREYGRGRIWRSSTAKIQNEVKDKSDFYTVYEM